MASPLNHAPYQRKFEKLRKKQFFVNFQPSTKKRQKLIHDNIKKRLTVYRIRVQDNDEFKFHLKETDHEKKFVFFHP